MARLTKCLLFAAFLVATQFVAPAAVQSATGADTPPTPPGPRVLVEYDMEGAAGLGDWRMASAWWPDKYAAGQRLLTEDVNAVVAGLFQGGAAAVDVYDQHGAGQPGFNVLPELLDRRVRRLFHRHDSDEVTKNAYDAVAIVAAHAKTGSGGFMAHTGSFGIVRVLNGRSVSEAESHAYSWGERGAPVIFVSGDDRLRDDLLPVVPWLEYVITKRALSPKTVELRPVDEVRREMQDAAARALRGLSKAKPLRLKGPVQAALRAVPPADLSALRDVPGINYQDGEVQFEARTLQEAMRGLNALQWIATEMGGQPIVTELLKGMPNWPEIVRRREAGFWERWIELETQRAETAVPRPARPLDAKRRPDTAAAQGENGAAPRSLGAFDADWYGAISRDGRYLTYVQWETGDLVVRDLKKGEIRNLTKKTGAWLDSNAFAIFSAISPDADQVAFTWFDELDVSLRLIGMDGSGSRVLLQGRDVISYEPQDWSPDGKQLLVTLVKKTGSETVVVSVANGSMRTVRQSHDLRTPLRMKFSPDGKYIAFDAPAAQGPGEWGVFVMRADGTQVVPVVRRGGNDLLIDWTADGGGLLFQSERAGKTTVWRLPVADGQAHAGPTLAYSITAPGVFVVGATRDCDLYYIDVEGSNELFLANSDPQREGWNLQEEPLAHVGSFGGVDWSPDGKYLVYPVYLGPQGTAYVAYSWALVIRTVATGEERTVPLPISRWRPLQPNWSANGRSIVITGWDAKGLQGVYQVDADSGRVTTLVQQQGRGDSRLFHPRSGALSPDGRTLYYARLSGRRLSIIAREISGGRERELQGAELPERGVASPALSPDGRWLAFISGALREGWAALNLMPSDGGESRELLRVRSPEGISQVAWMPDSSSIVVGKQIASGSEATVELFLVSTTDRSAQSLGIRMKSRSLYGLSIHPDGERLAFTAQQPFRSELRAVRLSNIATRGDAHIHRDNIAGGSSRPASLGAVPGEWVGYFNTGGDLVYLRVEVVTENNQLRLITRSMLPGTAGLTVPVQQQGQQITFALPIAGDQVLFTGVLEGEVLSGTTKAKGASASFEFRRKANIEPSLYDRYAGAYELADGRVIFVRRADRLSADPPSRIERSWLYWMDEAGNMRILIPSSARTFYSGPTYVVPVPPSIEVEFLPDKDGNFHQVLWREADKEALRGRRTRLYSEQEVRFSNGDVSLAGRLLMPAGAGPFPAVVVVHGGGPANRNWEYQIIADVLARHGIAALVYDKRGTGRSTGDWRRASFDDLAADAVAAARLLSSRKDVDPRKVGFWGISEAGWVAPQAAARSGAAFLILVSAPGLSHAELDLLSWESMLRDEQWGEDEIRAAKELAAVMIKFARTGEGWEEVVARMDAARSKEWFWLTEAGLFNPSSREHWFWTWYRLQLDHDPRPVLRALRIPILAIYGGKDTTIPEVNRKNVEQALQHANHPDYTVRVYPDADHTMLEVRSAAVKDLPRVRRHVPEYFKIVVEWLGQRVRKPDTPYAAENDPSR